MARVSWFHKARFLNQRPQEFCFSNPSFWNPCSLICDESSLLFADQGELHCHERLGFVNFFWLFVRQIRLFPSYSPIEELYCYELLSQATKCSSLRARVRSFVGWKCTCSWTPLKESRFHFCTHSLYIHRKGCPRMLYQLLSGLFIQRYRRWFMFTAFSLQSNTWLDVSRAMSHVSPTILICKVFHDQHCRPQWTYFTTNKCTHLHNCKRRVEFLFGQR